MNMAQLPPKIPNDHTIPNWPDFPPQKIPSIASFSPDNETATNNNNQLNSCWVDEFLDISVARRITHRRSVSDSIAFLEAPMLEQCHGGSGAIAEGPGNVDNHEFERYNDEQFMSMFNDEMHGGVMGGQIASSSNPSSPSDHNSINGERESQSDSLNHISHQERKLQQLKNEPEEDESECRQERQAAFSNNSATAFSDRVTDPKRVKRILANRQSAQRSRVRKLQYISELERSVTSLQAEVSVLSPRVAFLDHQRLLLNVDNSALKQRMAALAQDKFFKDAHQEALKTEIDRLRKVFHDQQNIKKMESRKQSPLPSPTAPSHDGKAEMKQVVNA